MNPPPLPPHDPHAQYQAHDPGAYPEGYADGYDDVPHVSVDDVRAFEEEKRKKSFWAAIGSTVLVHVALAVILGFIALATKVLNVPEIQVMTESDGSESLIDKPEFSSQSLSDRPSGAAAGVEAQINLANVGPMAVPMNDAMATDAVNFGNSMAGVGLGMEGFGPGGGGAKFLGLGGGGRNIYFVIDTSTSMIRNAGQGGIASIREELKRAIDGMSAGTSFNIVCFGLEADGFQEKSVKANKENKEAAVKFMSPYYGGAGGFGRTRTESFGTKGIDNEGTKYLPIQLSQFEELVGTSGGSRIDLGLMAAFKQRPSSIFVLSDGAPGTNKGGEKVPYPQLVEMIKKSAQAIYKTYLPTVNTIAIDGITNDEENFLKSLSAAFNGKHKRVSAAELKN